MERGFYHPSRGYWQTTGDVPPAILATYPDGTTAVPLRPSSEHEWNDGAWQHVPPAFVDPDAVNAERERRILAGAAIPVSGYGDIWLTGSDRDMVIITALLMKAQGAKSAGVTDPVLVIRDRNNVNHYLTPDQMLELTSEGMAWVEATMAVSWAMKDGAAPFEEGIPLDYTNDVHWP